MKVAICLFVCLTVAFAMPQREGAAFTNDAIRQAQSSHLIPQNAQIQNVSFLSCDVYVKGLLYYFYFLI